MRSLIWMVVAVIALLHGAQAQASSCAVAMDAPMVNVVPSTQDVRYDFSKGLRDLGAMRGRSGDVKASADQATGGLRYDKPELKMQVSWHVRIDNRDKVVCLFYDRVDISIALQPVIYVAREFKAPACRAAVLEHEEKHVKIDRLVMNKYAHRMGVAVQAVVNKAGVRGPYPVARRKEIEAQMMQAVEQVVKGEEQKLFAEMDRLQAEVDTPSEYKRISRICEDDMREYQRTKR